MFSQFEQTFRHFRAPVRAPVQAPATELGPRAAYPPDPLSSALALSPILVLVPGTKTSDEFDDRSRDLQQSSDIAT